jgi:hypothetical protein
MKVYRATNITKPDNLLLTAEHLLISNLTEITPDLASQIIIEYGDSIQEAELAEILEKKIGHGSEEILLAFGASHMLEVLQGFMVCEHSRDKIIVLLSDMVVREFSKLNKDEKCFFVGLILSLSDQTSHFTGKSD